MASDYFHLLLTVGHSQEISVLLLHEICQNYWRKYGSLPLTELKIFAVLSIFYAWVIHIPSL